MNTDETTLDKIITGRSIEVERRIVCGKQRIYPASQNAILFTRLTGNKTLETDDLRVIEALGFQIVYVDEGEKQDG